MALITKSDVGYTGNGSPLSYIDLTQTAQEFYNSYEEWVIADGGEIINPTQALDAITWAKTNKIMGKVMAVSASWGIKRSGSQVIKVYSLDRSTFVWTANAGTYSVTNGFPEILYPSTASYLKQEVPKRNITTKNVGFLMTAKKIGTQNFSFSINKGLRSNNLDFRVDRLVPGLNNYFSAAYTTGSVLANTAPANHGGSGGIFNLSGNSITGIKDGTISVLVYPSLGAQLPDYSSATSSEIWIGRYLLNGVESGAPSNSFFTEAWIVNDATLPIMLDLSNRLNTLYPSTI